MKEKFTHPNDKQPTTITMKQQQQQQRPQSQQSGSQIYGVHSLNFHTRNPSWDKSIGINASSSSSTAIAATATATATATAAAPKFRMNTTKTLLPMVLPPISGSSSPILVSSSSSNSSSSPLALRYSHGHLCYGSGGGGCGGGGGGPMFMSPQITAQREHSRAVQQLQQFQLQQVQPRSPLYVYNSSDSSGSSSGLRQHCEHYAEEEEEVEGEEEQYNHHRYHNHHHYRKRTDTADSNSNTTTQNYHNHHILFEDNEGEERRHHHHKTQDSVSSNSNSNSNSSSSSGKRRHRNSPLLDTNESEEQQDHNRPRHHRPHHHRRHHHKSGSRESGEYSHHSNESEEQQEHNHHKSSSRESGEHNDNDNYSHRSHSRKHKHKHSGSYSESSKDTYCTTTTSSPSNQGLKSSPFTSRSPILSITASTSDTPQDASNASPLTGVEYAVEPHRIAGCNFCQTNRRYFYSLSNKVVLHSTSHQQRCRRNNNNSNSNHYHQQQQQQQQQPAIYGYQYKLQPQQLLPQMSPRSSLQVQTNYPVHGYAKQAPGLGYAQLSGEGRSSSNSSNSSSSTTANITGPNTARAYTSSMSMSVEASSMSTSISGDEDTAATTTTTGTAAATATVETDVPLPSSGDILGDDSEPERYRVKSVLGKGAFGFVLQAYDQVAREDVAIKLVRNVPAYASMAMNEAKILELLSTADPSGDYNTLRAKRNHAGGTACWFLYRGAYVCIVTELLSTSLYSLIERTAFYGVSLRLVRNFGRQILVALSFLASPAVSVVHCDLKPENVLMCDPKKPNVRVIDFGSSVAPGGVLHKYAQSRFYRAPEVILRLPYSFPADMWSLACILFELHVGTPLFQGNNEAEQVAEFVSVLGLPPQRMILSSTVAPEYFVPRSSGGFTLAPRLLEKYDPRRLADMIGVDAGGPDGKRILEPGHSRSDYLCFLDLLERMLAYDPAERITPQQALGHAFFATV